MVKVANDPAAPEGDLPAPARPRDAEHEVSGISLRLIAGLAAAAHGAVRADRRRLDVSVDSTTPLRSALRDAGADSDTGCDPDSDPRTRLAHRLVLTDAAGLAELDGDLRDLGDVGTALDSA